MKTAVMWLLTFCLVSWALAGTVNAGAEDAVKSLQMGVSPDKLLTAGGVQSPGYGQTEKGVLVPLPILLDSQPSSPPPPPPPEPEKKDSWFTKIAKKAAESEVVDWAKRGVKVVAAAAWAAKEAVVEQFVKTMEREAERKPDFNRPFHQLP